MTVPKYQTQKNDSPKIFNALKWKNYSWVLITILLIKKFSTHPEKWRQFFQPRKNHANLEKSKKWYKHPCIKFLQGPPGAKLGNDLPAAVKSSKSYEIFKNIPTIPKPTVDSFYHVKTLICFWLYNCVIRIFHMYAFLSLIFICTIYIQGFCKSVLWPSGLQCLKNLKWTETNLCLGYKLSLALLFQEKRNSHSYFIVICICPISIAYSLFR